MKKLKEEQIDFNEVLSTMRSHVEVGFKNGKIVEFDTPLYSDGVAYELRFLKKKKAIVLMTNATDYIQIFGDEVTYIEVTNIEL